VGVIGVLEGFAAEVGAEGPVCCVGGRTQWAVGGIPVPGTREVTAPAGVVSHEPAEMIVRVRAGSTLEALGAALAEGGQIVALESEDPSRATVGGVLAVGRGGYRRLGYGPPRDSVLEMTAVNARGELIRAGAPLVKNVTGYDLCRLWVGSLGTLALTAEVVLRCRPRPETESWWVSDSSDPFKLASELYRPLSILWDGVRTWVGLSGYRRDVSDQARNVLGARFEPCTAPPQRPADHRRSLPPAGLRALPSEAGTRGGWLAEVGVGVVHCDAAVSAALGMRPSVDERLAALHRAVKERFDPGHRLNPGRSVLDAPVPVA
jgi:hypothetical protein